MIFESSHRFGPNFIVDANNNHFSKHFCLNVSFSYSLFSLVSDRRNHNIRFKIYSVLYGSSWMHQSYSKANHSFYHIIIVSGCFSFFSDGNHIKTIYSSLIWYSKTTRCTTDRKVESLSTVKLPLLSPSSRPLTLNCTVV